MRRVLAAVEDLMFRGRIQAFAASQDVETTFPRSPKKLLDAAHASRPDLLILDLNAERFEPLGLLQNLKADAELKSVPVVGYLSHVQKDLAVAAREFGCDRIMARSAFVKDLPRILAGDTADDEGDASIVDGAAGV